MKHSITRRRFLSGLSLLTASAVLTRRGFAASPEDISLADVDQAEDLLGLEFTPEQRELLLASARSHLEDYEALRSRPLSNDVPPAVHFTPRIQESSPVQGADPDKALTSPVIPQNWKDRLPFLTIAEQGALMRAGKLTSEELTRVYLGRMNRYDRLLECVITRMDEHALKQARKADDELRRGIDRGPLHGIPWGAKDLLATKNARTTWGAMPFKDQMIDENAAVVERLNEAGAVLIAKLSVGALAWGDVWYGGVTKNPWKLDQGSSGSSAGPASATVAGLCSFAIGTETLGSIISPSQRCGASGLRPTFGRVPRTGCMALSWTMDKIGPICRSAGDTALVLQAIHGPDGHDLTVQQQPFTIPDFNDLRVGYHAEAFSEESPDAAKDQAALNKLRSMGINLKPVTLPDFPLGAMIIILEAEAAAAFDELTRSGRDKELVRQVEQAWPNVFRAARFIPAVEYIQANRLRTKLMEAFDQAIRDVDVYVHPTYAGGTLLATNLTGHPTIVVPNGLRDNGTQASICFTGPLWGEGALVALASAYQNRTGYHRMIPPLKPVADSGGNGNG